MTARIATGRVGRRRRSRRPRSGLRRATEWLLALALGLVPPLATGQSVSILSGESGQGLLFSHRGNCYVVVPRHVLSRGSLFQLSTVAPVAFGTAERLRLRSAHDLEVGYVQPGLEARCERDWSELPKDIAPLLDSGAVPELARVRDSGLLERVPMRIARVGLDELWATMPPGAGVYPGTSGSVLGIDGVPIAMAIARDGDEPIPDAPDESVRFLRIDEIRAELARLIEGRTGRPGAERSASPDAAASDCASALPIESIRCDRPTVDATRSCASLADGGRARFDADSLPVTLDVELAGDGNRAVTRVRLGGGSPDDDAARPKSVTVQVEGTTRGGARRWRPFASIDLPPADEVAIENAARPRASRLKLRIASSWTPGQPVEIGCLRID